jgi:hypothetical protein
MLELTGCSMGDRAPINSQSQTWQTYRNPKYGFAFLYPDRWVAALTPEKADGQIFAEPQNPAVEIRGWASVNLLDQSQTQKTKPKGQALGTPPPTEPPPNFKTRQGVAGTLQVQITPQSSSLNFMVRQGKIRYHWRGSAPSDRFADYYAFFYHVVLRYQIPLQSGRLK